MIKIICIKKPSEEYTLVTGKTYSVGRKSCDLTFANDQSVSRNHATIIVDHPVANISNSTLTPSIVITDLGSKFGSFVNDGIENNKRVAMREPNTLGDGDRFRFGLQWNEYKIKYTPLLTTSSGLIKELQLLRNVMCELGAHLLPDWRDGCDYLITETITLTVKVVCALLSAKYIVTPQFFHDYFSAVKSKTKLPSPRDYLPPMGEKLPRPFSFEPNLDRIKLFDRKIFLFTTQKQARKIGVALKCAGGSTDLIIAVSSTLLKSDETLIIASPSDIPLMDAPTQEAVEFYQSAKKRTIPESEIGLAAVYKCIDRYCNPYFDIINPVFPQSLISQTQRYQSSTQASSTRIVPETQLSFVETEREGRSSQSQPSRNIVEETVVSSQSQQPGSSTTSTSAYRIYSLTQSQPMEFAMPTPRIKEESTGDSNKSGKTTGRVRNLDESNSVNKRRRDETTNSSIEAISETPSSSRREPSPKRPRSETNSTRYTEDSGRTLNSLFGMSDDDDEETESEEPPVPTPSSNVELTRSAAQTSVGRSPDDTSCSQQEADLILPSPGTRAGSRPGSSNRSPSKSPVKKENLVEPTLLSFEADGENSKRKKRADRSVEPGTSKKRRIDKISEDGNTKPPVDDAPIWKSVDMETSARNSKNKIQPIPESDIKPLTFKFAPLIRKVQKQIMQAEIQMDNGARSAFNFKSFKKVLPLCLNSTVANTMSEFSNLSRCIPTVNLRVYDSHGYVDSEPYVAANPWARNRIAKSPDKEKGKRGKVAQEPELIDTSGSVEEVSPPPSMTSSTLIRRAGRNARGGTARTIHGISQSTSTSTRSSKRGTTAAKNRSDSPPPFFKEEAEKLDSDDEEDDEWAF